VQGRDRVRRESTIALAAGKPEILITRTKEYADPLIQRLKEIKPNMVLSEGDSTDVQTTAATDMLFIKSNPAYHTLKRELDLFGPAVTHWIVIHDTENRGDLDERGGPGLWKAIREFMADHPEWFIRSHTPHQYGLTVLSCWPDERPATPLLPWGKGGPGTELKKLLSNLGINPTAGCDCRKIAIDMDRYGVEGCEQHFEGIIAAIRGGQEKWKWGERIRAYASAAIHAPAEGITFKVNPLDPFPGLVREAIKRARENPDNL
jgi:hypothetical protein